MLNNTTESVTFYRYKVELRDGSSLILIGRDGNDAVEQASKFTSTSHIARVENLGGYILYGQ